MNDDVQKKQKVGFDEYKLFYESTEKVTDRRLSANKWNYSICTAILVAVAAITSWGLSKPSFVLVSVVAIIILSGMAALYCSLWIGQIRDFKALNNAKFDILNKMAPDVIFGDSESDPRVSFCPFEKEWQSLQKANAIQEISQPNIIALKASNMEYLIPRTFRVLYILIIVGVAVISAVNWSSVLKLPQLAANG